MGLVGVLAVATLALSGGTYARGDYAHPAPAHPRPIVFGTEASNRRLAEVDAERELRSVRVPPHSRRVPQAPAPILAEPDATRGEPNLVQRWKWLVAPGTVTGTIAWFHAHPPAGSRSRVTTHRRDGAEGSEGVWFEVSLHSRRVDGPTVIPLVTTLSPHRVGIRLEVQQVWKTPHPAAAKVPAAARVLHVSRRVGGKAPKWQVIHSIRRVRRIARAIDRLPAAQPQILYGCEEFPEVSAIWVRMLFLAHEGGPPLAEAAERVPPYDCESMRLKVAGDPRTFSLVEGPRVIELLHR